MNVDFGTYHHSTPEQSRHIRERANKEFSSALLSIYPSDSALRILDAGCGLGFLTYVAAKCFPKARVTGVDLFEHDSLSEASIERAIGNMKALRVARRTSFLKHDLTKPMHVKTPYDLALSNLVFHNLGINRFKAYDNVFEAIKPDGYLLIGDLFPNWNADMKYFSDRATLVPRDGGTGSVRWNYQIKLLRKNSR